MGYTPTRRQLARQERHSSKRQLAKEAQQQIEDFDGVFSDTEREFLDQLFREMDWLDHDFSAEYRRQALSGRFEDGRPITSVSLYIAYVDEAVEDLGPLTDEERQQYHKVLAGIHADNESRQVLARV